tara:strand:- start:1793 stop:3451 length:1659 start_codon:yes stop_codon:yes gene_type:complete
MAYKFQSLAATMSGSLTQEGTLTIKDRPGATQVTLTDAGAVSGSSTLEAGGNLTTAGTVKFLGVADATVAIGADSIYFLDADGLMKSERLTDYATAIAGPGIKAVAGGLEIDLDEFDELAATPHATADEYLISDDGVEKRISVTNAANGAFALVSGDATVAAGGALTIAANAIQTGMVHDDVATELAGAGLSDSSGVLAVALSGAIHVASDKVSISGSVAGPGLGYLGGVDSIFGLELDIDELTALGGTGVAQGDHFLISDGGLEKKITASNLEDWLFGNVSGDATVAAGGALTLANNSVSNAQLDNDAVTGAELADDAVDSEHYTDGSIDLAHMSVNSVDSDQYVDGSVDLIHMSANSVDSDQYVDGSIDTAHIANDQITNALMADDAIDSAQLAAGSVDTAHIADDQITNALMADNAIDSAQLAAASVDDAHLSDGVATGLAGSGLTAASGVLSITGNNVVSIADSGTVAEGYNYFADLSSAATVTMPASAGSQVGDVCTVKAGNLTSGTVITINKAGSQTLDGLTALVIESPYGAVTMVYVASDTWRIV